MDTDDILTLLQEVAAEVITPRFRRLDEHEIAEKSPGDLVTVADREAEALITTALERAYPDAVVLGEEAVSDRPELMAAYTAAEHAFTVDPVDGTKNFVQGSPDHAVMVAELRQGVVVRAWIWQPQHELAHVAERGAGAWCNGERVVRAAPPAEPADWRVVTSRRAWIGRSWPGMRALELTWVSCGVDYPHVVSGDADVVLYVHAKPWDHAPGSLLLSEAGGHVGQADGGAYDPRREHRGGLVVGADRATYDTAVRLLGESGWR